ncbi:MAG TPA: transglycosylase SLT domain-containing protein [Aggregatilinea sp.]|jgi:soluble lytic murein transglycosylase-like protein|uniref:lytic transglycosylase domain-containing protein n=1 Tax=Aggregatilinea sp. TaxID=2806333 RepID=UPI002C341AAA|nr:transglycosylase SLT domain-containing protein [Aggregatilinea sp.]HML23097.1 transglycosylase SLT domain-containing protein [Aggregatilinea sp.]
MAKKEPDLTGKTPPAPRKTTPKEEVKPPKRPARTPKEDVPAQWPASSGRKKAEPAPKATGKSGRGRVQPPPEPPRRRLTLKHRALIAIVIFTVLAIAVIEPSIPRAIWPFDHPAPQAITDPDAPLASFYAPSVLHWAPQIEEWARAYELNPNVIAIVMQIESCGDPEAISFAGALGLMQVMPLHFEDGENMLNPDTNVRRGMNFFNQCLRDFADWDIGLALACYNGGPGVVYDPMETWPAETQRYYRWATGLWEDAVRGDGESATLDEWLGSGGQNLCTQASNRLSNDSSS